MTAQRGECPCGDAAYGALSAAENVGDVGVAEVLVVAQHEHRALLRRQLLQQSPGLIARGEIVLAVDHRVGRQSGWCDDELCRGATSMSRLVLVDQDAAYICVRVAGPAHAVPASMRP
jgi:hypothetical protein